LLGFAVFFEYALIWMVRCVALYMPFVLFIVGCVECWLSFDGVLFHVHRVVRVLRQAFYGCTLWGACGGLWVVWVSPESLRNSLSTWGEVFRRICLLHRCCRIRFGGVLTERGGSLKGGGVWGCPMRRCSLRTCYEGETGWGHALRPWCGNDRWSERTRRAVWKRSRGIRWPIGTFGTAKDFPGWRGTHISDAQALNWKGRKTYCPKCFPNCFASRFLSLVNLLSYFILWPE
jgi:hypothetical protein